MNCYRVTRCEAASWAVEWLVDGAAIGVVWGSHGSEAEAAYAAYTLSRMEYLEARRDRGARNRRQIATAGSGDLASSRLATRIRRTLRQFAG